MRNLFKRLAALEAVRHRRQAIEARRHPLSWFEVDRSTGEKTLIWFEPNSTADFNEVLIICDRGADGTSTA